MRELIIYVLETLVCSGALLAAYALLLERRVKHHWCRTYLLTSMAVAAIIPLLRIPVWPAGSATPIAIAGEITTEIIPGTTATTATTPLLACGIVYALGVGLIVSIMLLQAMRIRRLRRGADIDRAAQFTLVRTRQQIAAFSFLRSIYVWDQTPAAELAAIVAHESSHIAHRHSVERITMESIKATLWWNPFVWIAARKLTEVEEFEADSDVLRSGYDIENYMSILFKQLFGYSPEIANGLRNSLTKKRFKMMTIKSSGRYSLLRVAGVIPVVLALLCTFAFTTQVATAAAEPPQPLFILNGSVITQGEFSTIDPSCIDVISVLKDKSAIEKYGDRAVNGVVIVGTKEGKVVRLSPEKLAKVPIVYALTTPDWPNNQMFGTGEVGKESPTENPDEAFLMVENMPQFQGGDLNDFRNWVNGQVRYPAEAMKQNISGRVIVSFVVDLNGSLSDIETLQTPDKLLSDEVMHIIRTSSGLWTPGTQRGKTVRVKYTLPVEFNLNKQEAQTESGK